MNRSYRLCALVLLLLVAATVSGSPEECAGCTSQQIDYCSAACLGPYPPGGGDWYSCWASCCFSLCEPNRPLSGVDFGERIQLLR